MRFTTTTKTLTGVDKLSEEQAKVGYDPSDPELPKPTPTMTPVMIVDAASPEARELKRPLPKDEIVDAEWRRRLHVRAERHAVDQALQADLREAETLRAQAARLREQADAERAAGRPQHAKRIDVDADHAEYRAESREGRAEQCRGEFGRLRAEARRLGIRKIGSWLHGSRAEVSDSTGDPAAVH